MMKKQHVTAAAISLAVYGNVRKKTRSRLRIGINLNTRLSRQSRHMPSLNHKVLPQWNFLEHRK